MPRTLKPLILVAAVLAIGAALGTTAQPAQARSLSICSKALVHDWLVDGRVDKTYPVHCYREALRTIPEDQLVYGTLRDDLNRALQNTIRENNGDVNSDTPVPGFLALGGGGGGLGPNTAESVPVPLLVLGGLAIALMAAAGISFFARRMQARRSAVDPPPAGPSF